MMNKYKSDYHHIIKKNVQYGKLQSLHYSCSGDMNGNIYDVYFDVSKMIIKESKRDEHSDPLIVKEYQVSDEDLEKINDYVQKYNFPLWKDIPKTGDIVLDAAVSSLSFFYDNRENGGSRAEIYNIDFDMILPDEGEKVFKEFLDFFLEMLEEEKKINEYVEETN